MPTRRFGENTADDFNNTCEDTLIRKDNSLLNYGAKVAVPCGLLNTTAKLTRVLMRFKDISTNIGANAIITAATVNCYFHYEPSTTDETLSIYRVLLNWLEGTQDGVDRSNDTPYSGCWDEYGSQNAWNTAGCDSSSDVTGEDSTADRRATAEDSTTITTVGQYFSFDALTAAQNWYSGSWSEYGLIFINDDEVNVNSQKGMQTSEGTDGQRPYLSVTYSVISTIAVSLDTLLKKTLSQPVSLDSLFQKTIPITLSIDSLLKIIKTHAAHLESVLLKSGNTSISNIDTVLKNSGLIKSVVMDSYLKNIVTKSAYLDSLFLKEDSTYSALIDSLLLKSDAGKSLSIDALLSSLGIQTSLSIDALLEKEGISVTTALDAVLRTVTGTQTISLDLDSILAKNNVLATISLESLLSKISTKEISLDVLLQAGLIKSVYLDGLMKKGQITNVNFESLLSLIQTSLVAFDSNLMSVISINTSLLRLDSLFLQVDKSKVVGFDTLLYNGFIKKTALEAILVQTIERNIYYDSLLSQGNITKSTLLDAVLYGALISTKARYSFDISRKDWLFDVSERDYVFKI